MKYSKAQIAFHWITALLIAFMALSGLAYSYDLIDKPALNAHQILGQLLILILTVRVVARIVSPLGTIQTKHSRFERFAASLTHYALYLCLIAFVVTGYVSASALSDNVLLLPADIGFARSDLGEELLEIHFLLKWVLLSLFAVHITGVLKHALVDRDSTLSNMMFSHRKDQ